MLDPQFSYIRAKDQHGKPKDHGHHILKQLQLFELKHQQEWRTDRAPLGEALSLGCFGNIVQTASQAMNEPVVLKKRSYNSDGKEVIGGGDAAGSRKVIDVAEEEQATRNHGCKEKIEEEYIRAIKRYHYKCWPSAKKEHSGREALIWISVCRTTRRFPFLASNIILAREMKEIGILHVLRIGRSAEALPCNVDICLDVLDKTFFVDVVILGPYEAENQDVHVAVVEIGLEVMHDMYLDAAHCVLVEWIPTNRHDHWIDGALVR